MNAGAIDERVTELVAARRAELEQLVRQAVDSELAQLVEQELRARDAGGVPLRNGSAKGDSSTTTKLCATCGERPAAKYRRVCERCRQQARRNRENRAPAEQEPPRVCDRHAETAAG